MRISLRSVTRANWLEAIRLRVLDKQRDFVPTVAVSLAKVHVKPDGDDVDYLPFAIYADETMVGFVMHAYVESTTTMYWINGFLIDESQQQKGYGKAALAEIVSYIKNRFAQCKEIRLTVHPDNLAAQKLYQGFGFTETGDAMDGELVYKLTIDRE
ncbi:GNAT family N-acetyltransferase [Brevibacillus fluminis]|uniref:GNAT family N-acetyltransferase n=1 Tax=Brevibacillus fluminis TaxID=511487 RepID=UPI003F8A2E3A